MKTIDITSRLGQFAWRQIAPSTIPLPVIFRDNNREEYLCVQMINIHILSKFPSEILSYSMKQLSLQYFSLTHSEAKLFEVINQFHSNGYLDKSSYRLDYSKLDLAFLTPFRPFLQFYQLLSYNLQWSQNNSLQFSLKYRNPLSPAPFLEREKQTIDQKSSINTKRISNGCQSTNSYCQSIIFHEKSIISYCTTSANDSNKTILCLSIKDILSTFFPLTNTKTFLQLCQLKQIIRYKPDKSTKSDLSLRLIDLQQFEQFWLFFNEQLLSKPLHCKDISDHQTTFKNNSSQLTIDTNDNLTISSENSQGHMNFIQSLDEQLIRIETNSLLHQLIQIIEEQQNEIITDSFQNKRKEEEEEETILTIENQTRKRKRRQSQMCSFVSKRPKRKQPKDLTQWWINKYSIEPISILLQRVNLPID